jgi:hypothetical protein
MHGTYNIKIMINMYNVTYITLYELFCCELKYKKLMTKVNKNCSQASFYARVMFLKNIAQIEHKIPFKTVYCLGVWGLTTSSYVVYDHTTSGHMDV